LNSSFLFASFSNGVVKQWKVVDGSHVRTLRSSNGGGAHGLQLAPDNSRIYFEAQAKRAEGASNVGELWDLAADKLLKQFENPAMVRMSPDGTKLLITWKMPEFSITMYDSLFYDTATGSKIGQLDHANLPDSLVFSPDGSEVAAGANRGVIRWSAANAQTEGPSMSYVQVAVAQEQFGYDPESFYLEGATGPHVRTMVYSPDGKQLITLDAGFAVLWDLGQKSMKPVRFLNPTDSGSQD
jgi:WD40 repeat protein